MHDGEALSFWMVELAFVAKRLCCTKGKLYEFAKEGMKYMGGMPRRKMNLSRFLLLVLSYLARLGATLCE